MLTGVVAGIPRNTLARITGGLYLAFIGALVLADVFGLGVGDTEIALDAVTDTSRFAVGLVFGLLSALLFVMAAWGLYVLLQPVNRELALLFLLLNAIGVAIQVASYIPLIFAMLATDSPAIAAGFTRQQVESLQSLSFDIYGLSFVSAQLFFGTWLLPLGYLVYKSRMLPRFLGVLLILDGFAILLWFAQAILLPDYSSLSYPGLVLSFIAEAGLGIWLLLKGINEREEAHVLAA